MNRTQQVKWMGGGGERRWPQGRTQGKGLSLCGSLRPRLRPPARRARTGRIRTERACCPVPANHLRKRVSLHKLAHSDALENARCAASNAVWRASALTRSMHSVARGGRAPCLTAACRRWLRNEGVYVCTYARVACWANRRRWPSWHSSTNIPHRFRSPVRCSNGSKDAG